MEVPDKIEDKLIIHATVGELTQAIVHAFSLGIRDDKDCLSDDPKKNVHKHYVHGIQGIADLLGCSYATVARLKREGFFEGAYSQIKNIIVADADLLLDLYQTKMSNNRHAGF